MKRVRMRLEEPTTGTNQPGGIVLPPVYVGRPAYPLVFPQQAMQDVIEILGGEKWFDRKAALARAIWELQGRAMAATFGVPDNPAWHPEAMDALALGGQMRLLDTKLRMCLQILKAPNTITGANVKLLDLNEMIVLIECAIRITRLLIGQVTMRQAENVTMPVSTPGRMNPASNVADRAGSTPDAV